MNETASHLSTPLQTILRAVIFMVMLHVLPSVATDGFIPPPTLLHDGKTYTLAHQAQSGQHYFQYEYTTNGEPIERWSSLVTLTYLRNAAPSPQQWTETTARAFQLIQPKPFFTTFVENGHGYAMVLFPPGNGFPDFESDIQKSYHIAHCLGTVTYQFGVKRSGRSELAGDQAAYQTYFKTLVDENIALAEAARAMDWQPNCTTE